MTSCVNGPYICLSVTRSCLVSCLTCIYTDDAINDITITYTSRDQRKRPSMKVGLLGCMAERLKGQLLEKDKLVDVVCGPDAVRERDKKK